MPQLIDVPDYGLVEFPDGMSDQDIVAAIQRTRSPAYRTLGEAQDAALARNDPEMTVLHARPRDTIGPSKGQSWISKAWQTARESDAAVAFFGPTENQVEKRSAIGGLDYAKGLVPSLSAPMVGLPRSGEVGPQHGTAMQVAAGAADAVNGLTEFFMSPLGVATLGTANAPEVIRRGVAGAFAVDMATHAPELARQTQAAIKDGNVQKATEGIISFGATTAFIAGTAKAALTPRPKAERLAQELDRAEPNPEVLAARLERSSLPLTAEAVRAQGSDALKPKELPEAAGRVETMPRERVADPELVVQTDPAVAGSASAPETPTFEAAKPVADPVAAPPADPFRAFLDEATTSIERKIERSMGIVPDVERTEAKDFVRDRVVDAYLRHRESGSQKPFRLNLAINSKFRDYLDFREAEKRGTDIPKESLDADILPDGISKSEVVGDQAPGPSTRAQTGELSERLTRAIEQLPADQQAEVREFLGSGKGRLQPATAKSLRELVEREGITPEDMEPSRGPGAASPSDVGAQKERKFSGRFDESKEIEPETRAQTGNRFYDPRSNQETNFMVNWRIERRGEQALYEDILSGSPDLPGEEHVAGTINLTKRWNARARELAEGGKEAEASELRDKIARMVEVATQREGTEKGRTIQAFRMWSAMGPEGILRAYQTAVRRASERAPKGSNVPKSPDPVVEREILRRSAEIEKLPEDSFLRDEATAELLDWVKKQQGVPLSDIPMSWWYASILSGPPTQVVNAWGGFSNVLANAGTMMALRPRAALDILTGLFRGIAKEGPNAWAVLAKGDVAKRNANQQVSGTLELLKDSPNRFLRALSVGRYVSRAMAAVDTLNYGAAKEMRARVLAHDLARSEGLSGYGLTERLGEILNEGARKEAEAKADAEGLTGNQRKRRVNELIEQGRPHELVEEASEYGTKTSFNQKPEGVLGLAANALANASREFTPLKFVVPFTRIVANVANASIDFTPWGFKRLFYGHLKNGKWLDRSNAPEGFAAQEHAAKAIAGSLGMMALAVAQSTDEMDMTSTGPKDLNHRRQLMETGWRPYTVKIGDKFYSYLNTPLAIPMAIVGSWADGLKYNKMGEKEVAERLAFSLMGGLSATYNQTFLTGLSDLLGSLADKHGTGKPDGIERMFARTASAFVVPNAVKWVDKAWDPEFKSATGIAELVARETPVARSTMLKPILNVLGEPVKKEGLDRLGADRFLTTQKEDPLWNLIAEQQVFLSTPPKNVPLGNRTMEPEERYEYVEKSGKAISQILRARLGDMQKMDRETLDKFIDGIVRSQRERAKAQIREKAIRAGTLK